MVTATNANSTSVSTKKKKNLGVSQSRTRSQVAHSNNREQLALRYVARCRCCNLSSCDDCTVTGSDRVWCTIRIRIMCLCVSVWPKFRNRIIFQRWLNGFSCYLEFQMTDDVTFFRTYFELASFDNFSEFRFLNFFDSPINCFRFRFFFDYLLQWPVTHTQTPPTQKQNSKTARTNVSQHNRLITLVFSVFFNTRSCT